MVSPWRLNRCTVYSVNLGSCPHYNYKGASVGAVASTMGINEMDSKEKYDGETPVSPISDVEVGEVSALKRDLKGRHMQMSEYSMLSFVKDALRNPNSRNRRIHRRWSIRRVWWSAQFWWTSVIGHGLHHRWHHDVAHCQCVG